jgi:hypothetical protein
MKLATTIRFWIALVPIMWRFGFGRWYVFGSAPDWLVEMAAARWNPLKDETCVSLWNEAAKELNMRKHRREDELPGVASQHPD